MVDAVNNVGIVMDRPACAVIALHCSWHCQALKSGREKQHQMPVITRKFPRTVGGDTFILLDLKSEQGDKVCANVQDKRDGIWLFT